MNKLFAGAIVFLLALVAIAQNKTHSAEKPVLDVCKRWDDAYIKKDPAPLENLLTPDYIGIDEEGAVTTKSDEINLIKSGDYVIFSTEYLEPPKVRFHGDVAIVTTRAQVKHAVKGETKTINGRATMVCVKSGRQWQIASWHASRVKE